MTVSKSAIPSLPSSKASLMSSHPRPSLNPSQTLNGFTASSTSVTKATVDTTKTRSPQDEKGSEAMAIRELAAAAYSAATTSNGSSESGSPGPDSKSISSKNPSSWDPQDDILLRHLKEVRKLGWKDISQYFNNRTPNACQFRWRRLKSGNLRANRSLTGDNLAASVPLDDTTSSTENRLLSPAIPIPNSNGENGQLSTSPLTSRSPFNGVQCSNSAVINNNDNGAGSSNNNHMKVRSYSHSFSEDENIGFIPKIIVKSRGNSFVHPQNIPLQQNQQNQQVSLSQSMQQIPAHLSCALNTTLNTTKSRKNSFNSRSRRSSFSVSGSNTSSSRRSSIVMAPNSLSGIFASHSGSSTPKLVRKDSIAKKSSASTNFMDLPPSTMSTIPTTQRKSSRNHGKQPLPIHCPLHKWQQHLHVPENSDNINVTQWSTDEDQLLSENNSRNLSLMELSILLPNRSEEEIQWRLDTIFNEKSPSALNENYESPFNSPKKSITPEDTAIDEDTYDERDQANDDDDDGASISIEQANEGSFNSKEATPASIISSTTTKEDNLSDLSSSRSRNHSENMAKSILGTPNGGSKLSASFTTPTTTGATVLPGINTILKGNL